LEPYCHTGLKTLYKERSNCAGQRANVANGSLSFSHYAQRILGEPCQ